MPDAVAPDSPAPVEIPLRQAATVMLVRDGDGGLEVFMLRRNPRSEFVPGQFVFPGGAVDAEDRDDPGLESVCIGLDDATASARIDVDHGGLAYWVAAVRECFEEAGVLLARNGGGHVSFDDPDTAARFAALRREVHSGELRLAQMCLDEGLALELDDLRYVSHWITPVGPTRRFDTRFFIAHAPDGQEPLHDGSETVESTWIRPADAFAQHAEGTFMMIFPTYKNLEPLLDVDTVADLMAWAGGLDDIPALLPAIAVTPDGEVLTLLPGDEGYDEAMANPPPAGSMQ
ncbi:MAG: NUDIX domain-containing protein [Acidimicrobiales bacterium]|nr:NUDIX domain-containing protein [Acidimicrobiales bacterium]MYK71570.1 NUDIX domain-containing protein [Acidimicrobiales bacterium]